MPYKFQLIYIFLNLTSLPLPSEWGVGVGVECFNSEEIAARPDSWQKVPSGGRLLVSWTPGTET